MNFPVTCHVCAGPPERVATWRDECECRTYYAILCHGQQERFSVDDELAIGAEHIAIVDYVAFKPAVAALGRPQLKRFVEIEAGSLDIDVKALTE